MHLCEMGQKGEPLPDPLPINLVPPSLRRTWQGQQNGSAAGTPGSVASQPGAAGGNRLVSFLRKVSQCPEKDPTKAFWSPFSLLKEVYKDSNTLY